MFTSNNDNNNTNTVTSNNNKKKQKEEESCSICLQYLKIHKDPHFKEQMESLQEQEKYNYHVSHPDSCQHKFHKSCIVTWLQQNTACPICQNEILWINITIPQEQLQVYKKFRVEQQEINKQSKNQQEEKNKEQKQKQEEEEEQDENDQWSQDIKKVQQKKNSKKQQQEDDFPSLGGGANDGFPGLPGQQQEVFQQLPKENEDLLQQLSEDQQSTIQGNTEIITIQEINNYCKVYMVNKQDSENRENNSNISSGNQNISSQNSNNTNNNISVSNQDELSAFELIQLKEIQQQENHLEYIDHNFIKNEYNGLQNKYEEVIELINWNKLDLKKYEKQYQNPVEFLWFAMDEIEKKMGKIKNIFVKMYKFDCQKIMLEIDQIDRELEWARKEKINYIFDEYEYKYKKLSRKQQDNNIIWDFQQDKIQKIANKKNNSKNNNQNKKKSSDQDLDVLDDGDVICSSNSRNGNDRLVYQKNSYGNNRQKHNNNNNNNNNNQGGRYNNSNNNQIRNQQNHNNKKPKKQPQIQI